jgi:23S rRNA pseudouridine1911/1915/1917 synthase
VDVIETPDILFEDNHLIAVVKPAGVPSTHFDGEEETLDRSVKAYLKTKYNKPGNVFLGIVHRLDKPTSGVLVFARTSKGAARLSEQFQAGAVEKIYWAVVEGEMQPLAGSFDDWLRKDQQTGVVEIVEPNTSGAKRAITHYESRAAFHGMSFVELRPQTGRTHQLRVQLAHRHHPVVGDFKYGSETPFERGIALHARSITFLHPIDKEPVTLTAALPRTWNRFSLVTRMVAGLDQSSG